MDFLSTYAKSSLQQGNYLKNLAKELLTKRISYADTGTQTATTQPVATTTQPEIGMYNGTQISKEQFDQYFKPIYFGEVSNRTPDKQELEARVILSTILNRIPEHQKAGNKWDFAQTITQPNQYQAYNSPQYQQYSTGTLDTLGQKKRQLTDSISDKLWGELSQGKFQDITQGAYYYQHNTKNDTIEYDNTRKLYK